MAHIAGMNVPRPEELPKHLQIYLRNMLVFDTMARLVIVRPLQYAHAIGPCLESWTRRIPSHHVLYSFRHAASWRTGAAHGSIRDLWLEVGGCWDSWALGGVIITEV